MEGQSILAGNPELLRENGVEPGPVPLAEALLKVEYGAAEIEDAAPDWDQNQLICALYAALVRRADEIWVKDVKFPPKAGETANLP